MANREIVGWFTRGGKRVPIFKGESSPDKKNRVQRNMARDANYLNSRVKPKKSDKTLTSDELKREEEKGNSRHYRGREIYVEKYYDTYEPSVKKYRATLGKKDKDGNFVGKKSQDGFLNEGEADRWGVGTALNDDDRARLRKNAKGLGRTKARVRSARRKKDGR